jgi:hypothetical protein
MRRRKPHKRPRRYPIQNPFKAKDALLFSGASVLIAMAMGASPDKAMDYGIQVLKLCGARVELESEEEKPEKESDFMLGLA